MNKISPELSMALEIPKGIREKSLDLNLGYDKELDQWELIIRYTGDLTDLQTQLDIEIQELFGGYGIVYVYENQIDLLASFPQIDYIEKPKRLLFERMEGILSSCVPSIRQMPLNLTGQGVLVALIDSGAFVKMMKGINLIRTGIGCI